MLVMVIGIPIIEVCGQGSECHPTMAPHRGAGNLLNGEQGTSSTGSGEPPQRGAGNLLNGERGTSSPNLQAFVSQTSCPPHSPLAGRSAG